MNLEQTDFKQLARQGMAGSAIATMPNEKMSLLTTFASSYGMEAKAMLATLQATVIPGGKATPEQVASFVVVAHQYKLNPFTREIFAFPTKSGGIQPVVSVDGWAKIVNEHPYSDGFALTEIYDDKGNFIAVSCRMYRKDKAQPIEITEYLKECARDTEPWRRWPMRLLRHKAFIQCARYAFGFAGIVDPDEAERNPDLDAVRVPLTAIPATPGIAPAPYTAAPNIEDARPRRRGRPPKVKADEYTRAITSPTEPEPTEPEGDDPLAGPAAPFAEQPREPGDEPEPTKNNWSETFK